MATRVNLPVGALCVIGLFFASLPHPSPAHAIDVLTIDCADTLGLARHPIVTEEDVRLIVRNIDPSLVINQAIHASIMRIPDDGASLTVGTDGLTPTSVTSLNYLVEGDSVSIVIAGDDFAAGDALEIQLSRITPELTIAPGQYPNIRAAIAATEVGNTVVVLPRQTGLAYQEHKIYLKNGVRVIAAPSDTIPKIQAEPDVDTLIVFPENANAFTSWEGVDLQAGDSTKAIVAIRGAGSIGNCSLNDMGVGMTVRGIVAEEHTGEIRNCKIEMTSQTHIPGQVVTAIDLGDLTGSNGSHVVGCSIDAKTSFSRTYGITTSIYADALIESTFVTAEYHGISLWDNSIARFCTVDGTHHEGIVAGGAARVENCIVTNMLGAWEFGIIGNNIDYCICPYGVSEFSGVGNSTEDPYYCGPEEYTLRLDSYGNPENNNSGKQIGAFPVECSWGTLARDVTHSTTPVTLKGDLTIPFGRSLVLNDAPVMVDTVDFVHGGQDTNTAELLVGGTLSISAVQSDSVVIQSKSGVRGSWDGIILGQGAKLFLDYVVIRDGKFGLTDNTSLTGDTVRVDHCTFRNVQTAGIYLTPLGLYGSDAAPLTISSSYVYMAHAPYGIYLKNWDGPQNNFYNVAITDAHVLNQGASEGIYGMYLYGRGLGSNNEMKVANSEVTQIPYGTGIFVEDLSPSLDWNLIRFCQRGIELYGSGTPSVRGRATAPIGSCGYGLVVGGYSRPVVDSLSINAPYGLTSCYGLYGDDYAGGPYSHMSINMNFTSTAPESLHVATAFQAYSQATADSTQKLRSSRLERFYRGVNLSPTSTVNLGGSGQERGNNDIYATAAIAYVGAKSRVAGLPNILARYDYWGADPPPTSMLASWVDYSHWLTSSPLSIGARLPELEMVALKAMMTTSPNPFRGSLTIQLQALPLATQCDVALFDVSGREIRRWSQPVVSSEFQVAWDGRDYLGSSVPPGVYLLRVSAGHQRLSTKLVKLAQ